MVKILIVEDESIVALALQEMIEQLGYNVVGNVLNGEEAIEKTMNLKPDLILMDIRLKGTIDGVETARKIRNKADIPIIYLTAYGDEETVHRAKKTDPSAYIIKPFNELSLRSNIEIVLHQQKLKEEILDTKNHLETIINNISDMLFCFNEKNRLTVFNAAAETITGYSQKELLNKTVDQLPFFQDHLEMEGLIQDIRKNHIKHSRDTVHIQSKSGKKKAISISSTSFVKNAENNSFEIVILGREISPDVEILSNLSKGFSYLWYEKNNEAVFNILEHFKDLHYNCLIVSRMFSRGLGNNISIDGIEQCFLSELKEANANYLSDLDTLKEYIHTFCLNNANPLILIDRLEYFIVRFSFEKVMLKLFEITDLIRKSGGILILHMMPGLLNSGQQVILENEFAELPAYDLERVSIDIDSHKILNLLLVEKQKKHIVNYKILKDELFFSYPTITHKINALEKNGLVTVIRKGRTKIIEITWKGETLLKQ